MTFNTETVRAKLRELQIAPTDDDRSWPPALQALASSSRLAAYMKSWYADSGRMGPWVEMDGLWLRLGVVNVQAEQVVYLYMALPGAFKGEHISVQVDNGVIRLDAAGVELAMRQLFEFAAYHVTRTKEKIGGQPTADEVPTEELQTVLRTVSVTADSPSDGNFAQVGRFLPFGTKLRSVVSDEEQHVYAMTLGVREGGVVELVLQVSVETISCEVPPDGFTVSPTGVYGLSESGVAYMTEAFRQAEKVYGYGAYKAAVNAIAGAATSLPN